MSRLLVVDDDPHVSRTLVELLALHGFEAARAESGEQGLDRLSHESLRPGAPRRAPSRDERVRGLPQDPRGLRGASLPVIMLTAYGDVGLGAPGLRGGGRRLPAEARGHRGPDPQGAGLPALEVAARPAAPSREEAQARARDLALLHEIGRDWSLVTEPEAFSRLATAPGRGLIGAAVCGICVYDRQTRTMTPALPVFGLDDEVGAAVPLRGGAPAPQPAELRLGARLPEQPRAQRPPADPGAGAAGRPA